MNSLSISGNFSNRALTSDRHISFQWIVYLLVTLTTAMIAAQHTPNQRHLLSLHPTTSGSGSVSVDAPDSSIESSSIATITASKADETVTAGPRLRPCTTGTKHVSRFASRLGSSSTRQTQRKRELNDLHHAGGELISLDDHLHPSDQQRPHPSTSTLRPSDDEYVDDMSAEHDTLSSSTTAASVSTTVAVVSPPKLVSRRPVLRSNGSHILTSGSNRLPDWRLATQHLSYVLRAGRCKLPSARLVSLKTLFPDRKLRKFLPHCALLHRCEADSGCCGSEHESCQPKTWHPVQLPFWSIELTASGQQRKLVEWLKFDNHTECECKPIVGIRK
jgi:hypothetical protein